MLVTILSFAFFQLLFLAVGLSATFKKRAETEDYLVAGRSVHPWLMALATASTNSSGFMFIGLIGETYRVGLSSMWLMVGWVAGDYLAWMVIHERLRRRSAEVQAQSVPSFVAATKAGTNFPIRVVAGLLTLVFLGTYAAAQLTAGSKALQALFGWPPITGALMGALMIAAYCSAGGIRASIWTNTTQAIVMIVSMSLLLGVSLTLIGGPAALWNRLRSIDPALIDWRPADARFGFFAFMLSWLMAGVGVLGQPHLVTIAMSIESPERIRQARPVYFIWYVVFSAACILVGLCCRVLLEIPQGTAFDDELALPRLSIQLLPPVLVGLILAGLFAATLSTADTQILCCCAALTQDLVPRWGRTYGSVKVAMLGVTVAVLLIALYGPQSVFELVVLAWSVLASALAPLVVVQAFHGRITGPVGVAMMLAGTAAALTWRYGLGWSGSVYEVLPGMTTGFVVYGLALLVMRREE